MAAILPGGWLKVTCGLAACTPGSAQDPTLGDEYGITLPFLITTALPITGFTDVYDVFCHQERSNHL